MEAQHIARRCALEAQQRQEQTANRHRRDVQFHIGDWVHLSTKFLSLSTGVRKLSDRFVGPFQVIQRMGSVAYRLALPATSQLHPVFHVPLLRPLYGNVQTQPLPDILDHHLEYEVQEILQHRLRRRQHQFWVYWRGFPLHDATWEPLSHLAHAHDVIADYARRHHLRLPGFEDKTFLPRELCHGRTRENVSSGKK